MMGRSINQGGFTFLGILITVVIICILAAGGLQVYTGVGGSNLSYDPDTVKGGLNLINLRNRLRSLAIEQGLEYSINRRYITNLQDLMNRALGVGYYPNAEDPVPAIPMFDIKMEVTSSGFVIKAIPDTLAGAPRDSPTYVIDNGMQIREE